MEKQLKREVKNLLLGRTVVDEEGLLNAAPAHVNATFYGLIDSSALLTVTSYEKTLRVADDAIGALQKLTPIFEKTGKMILLQTEPDALACLRRGFFRKSIVLTARNAGDGKVALRAFAGGGLWAKLCCRSMMRKIEKALH